MTQMLLFDTPTKDTTAFSPVVASANPVLDQASTASPNGPAKATEPESGLNHMGDLARLVILRYELVAKRRAAREAAHKAK